MAQSDPWDAVSVPVGQAPQQSARPSSGPMLRTIAQAPNPQQDIENQRKDYEAQLKALDEQRAQIKFQQEQEDRDQRGGVATTESEKTAAFLATRVANGIRDLNSVSGGQSPEVFGSIVGAINETAGNYATSADRQRVEAAQRDILDAALTLGTGAAYTAEQLEGYRVSYFPRLGDDQATIDDKSRRLRTLLEAAKVKAGAAAPAIDEALALVGGGTQQANQVDPQAVSALDAAMRGGASFEEIMSLAQRLNVQVTPEQVQANIALRDAGKPFSNARAVGGEDPYATEVSAYDARVQAAADDLEARHGESGLLKLAEQGITLGLSDQAAGIGGAIGGALRGDFDVAENYQLYRDIELELVRRARERTGGFGTAAELVGGGGAIRTVGNAALNAGRALASSGAPVTRTAIQGQMARQAGVEGAGVGAAAGFGYGEGTEESLAGTALGAAGGYALGRGGQSLSNRFANRTPPPTGGNPQGSEAIAAADRLNTQTGSNMRLMPSDVSGPGIRNATGGAAKMTLSGELIGRRAEAMSREAEKAKDALVSLAGGRAEAEVAGETALEGARKWMRTSATKRDALYAKARKAGGDEPVDLANARQVLDGHIAELSQTPGSAAGVERLRALRAELDNPFPVEGVKRMRTRLRDDFGSDGLRATDIERRVGQVIDAAEDDIVTSLQAAGKGNAATAYRQAATAHRERVQVIDEVLAPIIGKKGSDPKSGEQIIRSIEQAAQSNSAKLGRFINTLPTEDAGVVRGTLIDRLGKASASQQDETGGAFSLNTFLTNWSKMSDRAKSSLFGGELRASLEDLAKVANARRESGRFVNFSNTGSTMGNLASGGALVGSVTNPATLGLFAIDGLTGALLSSPRFARWLAKMPTQPAMQRKHIMGLEKIAGADSAIAADALGLQQQLLARFGAGDLPLAAEAQGKSEGSDTTGSGTQ